MEPEECERWQEHERGEGGRVVGGGGRPEQLAEGKLRQLLHCVCVRARARAFRRSDARASEAPARSWPNRAGSRRDGDVIRP